MITIFCGDNVVLSRKALFDDITKAQERNLEIVHLNSNSLNLTALTQALESRSFFKDEKLVVIENLFSGTKSKEKEKMIGLVKKNSDSLVYIWEGKKLLKSQVIEDKKIIYKQFNLTSSLFKFLDTLKPGNQEENLLNYHECLNREDPEMIFAMMIRQIRLLTLAKEGEEALGKLAPWQKNKLIYQATPFESESLKDIYKKILEIDFQQKTSQSSLDLASSLDLLIMEI